MDCMDFMRDIPDKSYDLAIVDPEYGIGESGGKNRRGKSKHKKKKWDDKPAGLDYFNELFRVSKNQIIWGANYFVDKINIPSMGWICWDKKLDNSDFSDFELAFSSFNKSAKIFRHSKNGGSRTPVALSDIIHPTQKPVKLYRWVLKNYAKQGDKILDTHGGSMSSAIACDMEGFDLDIIEKDKDYFNDAVNRFNNYKRQLTLF